MFSQEELIGLFLADDKSEFKSADELDDATLMSIRKKYFKGTFVVPFIVSLISIAILNGCVLLSDDIIRIFGPSDIYDTAVLIVGPLCGALACVLTIRWIFSLIIVSKIRRKKFLYYLGFIRGKNWRYPASFSRMHKYYSVADKYFALLMVNPIYKKGTGVYFLYFPGLSDHSSIGGAVVKYED